MTVMVLSNDGRCYHHHHYQHPPQPTTTTTSCQCKRKLTVQLLIHPLVNTYTIAISNTDLLHYLEAKAIPHRTFVLTD
jgi:hypothetical protein